MTTVDLDAIREEYLKQCGPHDFGLVEYGCNCPSGEPRWAIQRLADEVERLRQELDEARAERDRWRRAEVDAWHEMAAVAADRDRMRPVVEAAEAWAADGPSLDGWRIPAQPDHIEALLAAVDAFRSGTPDAEPAPGVPVDTEATP